MKRMIGSLRSDGNVASRFVRGIFNLVMSLFQGSGRSGLFMFLGRPKLLKEPSAISNHNHFIQGFKRGST